MRWIMKRLLFAFLLATSIGSAPAWSETPEEMLARSDDDRTLSDMSFEVRLSSYSGDRISDESTLLGVLKLGSDHNRLLMSFTEPASSRGQKLLVDGDSVYILFVRTTNPIRLSPLELLTGQASDGDVIRTFARDYDIESFAPDSLEGTKAYRFSLVAKEGGNGSSYKRVRLWVDSRNSRLLYAEYYAASGSLLKKAYYRDYRSVSGKDIPFTVDIYAGDDAQKHTTMSFSKIGQLSLPDTEFRRGYLNAWAPKEPR
jgi:outer membrane lipoprotein-sorting protein